MRRTNFTLGFILLITSLFPQGVSAQLSETATWAAKLTRDYGIHSDITYHKANNYESKLDLYLPREINESVPVVIYIHGGGWVFGSKEGTAMSLMPYLEKGWAAVTIGYRLANVSKAPAAAQDARCALRWVTENAERWKFDNDRIVVTGHSAGGHLALTTGLLTEEAGLGRSCPGTGDLDVAAVINWYGITDVGDLLEGENKKNYAVAWLGSQPNRFEVADRVSPLSYVNSDSPPVLTIHGNEDPVVPYSHALRLHEALEANEVPNRLVTIEGGGHGGFDEGQVMRAYTAIDSFLEKHLISSE